MSKDGLRVLLPEAPLPAEGPLTILFVLPVEAGLGTTWGDGMATVERLDLHNRHGLVVVAPSFDHTPWYADHPTDPDIRQESAMIEGVAPAADQLFPVRQARRLLLGFSKSGWGAISLLLRRPDLFDAAAAWDAPLMQERPDRFGMGPIFGTQGSFDGYYLPRRLRENATWLRDRKRLALLGYDAFRDDMQRAHALLEELRVPHDYADGPRRLHHWESGWVEDAVEALVRISLGGAHDGEASHSSGTADR
jgi:hypothetical protein